MTPRPVRLPHPPTVALLLAVALLAALPAVAQPPGGGPGRGPAAAPPGGPGPGAGPAPAARLAAYLDLTEAQVAAAKELHQTTAAAIQPLREQNRALAEELRALLEGDAPDATAVGEKAIALHAGRDRIRSLREEERAAFEALLTPDQRDKLAVLAEVRKFFGPHPRRPGDGGPGGPPEDGGAG